MLICPKCSHTNETKAERCSGCSEPFDHSAPTNLAENPEQLIGRIVNGKYQVLSILGEGGMGVVYKVRHLILQNKNTFALKILHPKLCAQPDFHARFLREVEIAMELTHENIIQIRDFGMTEQNLLFYTMDFFAGDSLKRTIEVESPLPPRRVVGIVRQILLALAEAHKAGIIHRDLKPDNLLIERINDHTDRVRILDFGIAKILVGDGETDEKHANITQGGVLGTPKYMSPEQASGERIDGRSDLYALGCIAYEMLTGSVPFTGNTTRAILVAHLTSPPLPFKEVKPELEVPAHVESLVFRLLEKDREKRPATAEAVLEILTGRPTAPAAPPSPAHRPARTVMLGAALALVLALASAGFFLSPFPHGEVRRAEAAGRGDTSGRSEELPAPPEGLARKLRCAICGATYARGEKVGDMCHGEPLVEAGAGG